MLQKAIPIALLLTGTLAMSCVQADETLPVTQIQVSDSTSKLARINPVFATRHKGCPMLEAEGKISETEGKPCPYHDAHPGAEAEHCDHEKHQ